MIEESSKKNNQQEEDVTKDSSKPVNDNNNKVDQDLTSKATDDDCVDDIEKGKAVVGKLFEASSAKASGDTIDKRKKLSSCKCMKRKGQFYCYRLQQGAWVQVSGRPYPSQETCEADNCFE